MREIELYIDKEIQRLRKTKKEIQKSLLHAPKGRLRCSFSHNSMQYLVNDKYLKKKDISVAEQIATRDYCEKLEKELDVYLYWLEGLRLKYQNAPLESVFSNLCDGRRALVSPVIEPIEEVVKRFEDTQYEPAFFDENDRNEFYTERGERVRSKTELLIANELYHLGIPYKYEMPIVLEAWGKPTEFRPDFTVMNKRTGRIYYIEHLGMMDHAEYARDSMNKIAVYERNGILLGRDLLIFHESSGRPVSMNTVKRYIEEFLL